MRARAQDLDFEQEQQQGGLHCLESFVDIHTTSSPSIGPTSVTDEPSSETSYSSIATDQHHSSNTSASAIMDGFPTGFGLGGAMSSFFTSTNTKQLSHDYAASSSATSPARVHQPGMRDDSEESSVLHNSSDVAHRLSDPACQLGVVGSSHGSQRHTSYASDITGHTMQPIEPAVLAQELEAVQNELDNLKAKMFANAERASHTGEANLPATIQDMSPAERLALQHACGKRSLYEPTMGTHMPVVSDTTNFPDLHAGVNGCLPAAHGLAYSSRKLSYASAAGSCGRPNNGNSQSATRSRRADSKIPAPTSSATPLRFTAQDLEDDQPVMVSPPTDSASPSSNGKPAKGSPHFAQPTKAFARRASETLRRDSVNAAIKQAAESSPTKSIRSGTPGPDAERKTQSYKRKSLPEGWACLTATQHDGSKPNVASGPSSPPTVMSSPTSDGEWQIVSSETATHAAHASKAGVQKATPLLRKKISTYMSPTAATTQRTIATLGEEPVKRSVPRVKSVTALKLDTEVARQFSHPSPDSVMVNTSSTESSTGSEQLSASAGLSPMSPPEVMLRTVDFGRAKPGTSQGASKPTVAPFTQKGKLHARRKGSNKKVIPNQPSKIPQARRSIMKRPVDIVSPVEHVFSDVVQTDSATFLDSVANTTTKRRTSHADILTPIHNKLESLGLRKPQDPHHTQQAAVMQASHAAHEQSQRQTSAALSDVILRERQGNAGKKIAIPPHRKAKGAAFAESKTQSTPAADSELSSFPPLQPALSAPHQRIQNDAFVAGVGPDVERLMRTANAAYSRSSSVPTEKRGSSSLRATARSFEPLWKPKSPVEEFGLLSWKGSLDYYTEEQWAALPEDIQRSVVTLRQFKGASPIRNTSPSKRADQRFWGSLLRSPQSESTLPANNQTTLSSPLSDSGIFDMTSPHGVQAGQQLKPDLSPGKKTVQWTLQDIDGQQRNVSFGRAPAPPTGVYDNDDHASISPTSDTSSPFKAPQSPRAWTIGAGYSTRPYGWKGGDGREISFSGYGPQAEFNAARPVEMEFYARQPFSPVHEQYGPAKRTEYRSPLPKVWPKSQKQWAEYAGYGQAMKPCGNMEIVSAVEQLPLTSQMMGLCNDCAPSEVC
ncbi:hypothetical protein LTR17_023517 [Elasticomyces elasticus]|nr:hypothetical protein LTR17_023517 [Elasticomyces elasticus]